MVYILLWWELRLTYLTWVGIHIWFPLSETNTHSRAPIPIRKLQTVLSKVVHDIQVPSLLKWVTLQSAHISFRIYLKPHSGRPVGPRSLSWGTKLMCWGTFCGSSLLVFPVRENWTSRKSLLISRRTDAFSSFREKLSHTGRSSFALPDKCGEKWIQNTAQEMLFMWPIHLEAIKIILHLCSVWKEGTT